MSDLARRILSDDLFAGRDFFNDVFDTARGNFLPTGVRHHSEDGTLEISFDVPGLTEDQLSATIQNNIVTVSGESEGRNYLYRLRVRNVDVDSVEHTHQNGVLTLTFQQADAVKERNLLGSGKKSKK
jgi:HSP20 family molecular chaperone IbpA